jgi:uncharacterized low-complexity protein
MSKRIRKPLSIAIGAAVVTGLGLAGIANANELDKNLFSMEELTSGYLTAGDEGEGSCGEGNCGNAEGNCGEGEGGCGEDKKDGEGKCGEGKCGGAS